jgi:hypothetical protein
MPDRLAGLLRALVGRLRGRRRCACGHLRRDHEWSEWMSDQSRVLEWVEFCVPCRQDLWLSDEHHDCLEFRAA